MSKNLPAAVITQIDAANKRPVLLFELYLASTLRFAAYKTNITFPTGGSTYTAKAITTGGLVQSLEGQIERVSIKFDNVQKDMSAYANNENFFGKKLIVKRVYLDALGDASNYNELFNGLMEQPSEITRESLTVTATIGKTLNKKALSVYYQKQCPWVFGGTECNKDGHADLTTLKATGTADSGTASTLVDNALTQADDYWNYGSIEITKSTKTYYRKIKDFVASTDTLTLDVELPITIDNTCTYVLYKGCEQIWECCSGSYAYGPSADNSVNFGGCIHIVKRADSE